MKQGGVFNATKNANFRSVYATENHLNLETDREIKIDRTSTRNYETRFETRSSELRKRTISRYESSRFLGKATRRKKLSLFLERERERERERKREDRHEVEPRRKSSRSIDREDQPDRLTIVVVATWPTGSNARNTFFSPLFRGDVIQGPPVLPSVLSNRLIVLSVIDPRRGPTHFGVEEGAFPKCGYTKRNRLIDAERD